MDRAEVLLIAAIRQECETVMAWRAAMKPQYGNRAQYAQMWVEIHELLDQYNLLTLGRLKDWKYIQFAVVAKRD